MNWEICWFFILSCRVCSGAAYNFLKYVRIIKSFNFAHFPFWAGQRPVLVLETEELAVWEFLLVSI
jgi:hypothetical protein